jgi:hypothetical protein
LPGARRIDTGTLGAHIPDGHFVAFFHREPTMPACTPHRSGPAAAVAATLLLAVAGCGSDDDRPGSRTTAVTSASVAVVPTVTGAVTGSPAAVLSATEAFLATLDDTRKAAVQDNRSAANLAHWSNLPDQLFERAGLRMDVLSGEQKASVLAILRAGLSTEGYNQVARISAADGVLAGSARMNLGFGADRYWIRILGTPSAAALWTVQYGGHHLGINMTMKGARMTLAPSFWGAQPASYAAAGGATEPLGGETRAAFALIGELDDTQRQAAVLDTAVTEIVLGAGRDGRTLANEGLRARDLSAAQRKLLTELIAEWINAINPAAARAKLATAAKELNRTWFAWHGATTRGNPVYYRVTSPSYLIEFAHQRGKGADAGGITHIHAIYREVGNDYGTDL